MFTDFPHSFNFKFLFLLNFRESDRCKTKFSFLSLLTISNQILSRIIFAFFQGAFNGHDSDSFLRDEGEENNQPPFQGAFDSDFCTHRVSRFSQYLISIFTVHLDAVLSCCRYTRVVGRGARRGLPCSFVCSSRTGERYVRPMIIGSYFQHDYLIYFLGLSCPILVSGILLLSS